MAIGVGRIFNVKLPQNFNNPYISLDIQDFWRRWHMTLSRFLRDYVYIPLGGNRKGNLRTYFNLFIVFLLCGFWHGASWMFVLWGVVHGVAILINRVWQNFKITIPAYISWLITFLFVNFAWVIFRANDLSVVKNIYKAALGGYGFAVPKIHGCFIQYKPAISSVFDKWDTLSLIIPPLLIIIIFCSLIHGRLKDIKPNIWYAAVIAMFLFISLLFILEPEYQSPFIYFNF